MDNSSAKGEYHTLSMKTWIYYKTIKNAPEIIRIPKEYIDSELRIYANVVSVDGIDDSKFLKNEHKLNKGHWQDMRKSEGNERGMPFIVTKGLMIRLPIACKDIQVIIYVEKNKILKEDAEDGTTNNNTKKIS